MGNRNAAILTLAGALAGATAWAASEPFVSAIVTRKISSGAAVVPFASVYAVLFPAALAGSIAGALAFVVSRTRTGVRMALASAGQSALIAAFVACVVDNLGDWILLGVFQGKPTLSSAGTGLLVLGTWQVLLMTSITMSVALGCQPTPARLQRALIAGITACALVLLMATFVALGIVMTKDLSTLAHGDSAAVGDSSAWHPWSLSRLFQVVVQGASLGLALGMGGSFLRTAWLRREWPRGEHKLYPLDNGPNRIGTAEGVEIPLFGEMGVQPVHAVVDARQGHWVVVAATSDGVAVNGQVVRDALLEEGSVLQIGPATLRLVLGREGRTLPYEPSPVTFYPEPVQPVAIEPRFIDPFGNVLAVPMGSVVLGRGPDAGVRLDYDSTVSRRHAELIVTPTDAAITDLGSGSGTFVNQKPAVGRMPLANGDEVRVGATTLTYRC